MDLGRLRRGCLSHLLIYGDSTCGHILAEYAQRFRR